MRLFSRVCVGSAAVAASLFLVGCQGLVGTGPQTPGGSVQVNVALAGSGTGTVTSSPSGISCGDTCSGTFSQDVTLTAAPDTASGFVFKGWSGTPCSGMSTCTIPAGTTANVTATFNASLQSIKHIIFMVQENRGFDHYFGMLGQYRASIGLDPDVAGLPANASNPTNDRTGTVPAFHLETMCVENPSPSWNESHIDFNRDNPLSGTATLDGFVQTAAGNAMSNNFHDIEGKRIMGYYDQNDLPFYYWMAANFATSDNWFSPVMTRTQPNRMFLVAATSAGHIYPIPPASKLNNKTIFQALEEKGISWKVYVGTGNPTLIEGSITMSMFSFSDSHPNNFALSSTFKVDADNDELPQVAFIDAGTFTGRDEHPADDPNDPGGSVQFGSNFAAEFINDLMRSPSWKDSAFILTWDEGGGFYDHIPPYSPAVAPDGNTTPVDFFAGDFCSDPTQQGPTCGFTYTGYRVPMIVISPYTAKNHVDHDPADYTAILKFIETRFGMQSLTNRDAAQITMENFFDFETAAWKTPPAPADVPVQPSPGPCYLDSLP